MRAPIARLTEKGPPKSSSGPGNPSSSAQGNIHQRRRLTSPERAAAFREGGFGNRGRESGAARYAASGERPSAERAVRPSQPAARTQQPSAPASIGARQGRATPARPRRKPNANSSVKPPPKVDDPFADLESLEAEMARLLGREKPG